MAPDKIFLVPAFPETELSIDKAMQKFFGQQSPAEVQNPGEHLFGKD